MDLLVILFGVLPIAYIIGYVYALLTYILPWLSVPITEIVKMTLWQLVVVFFFFTGGSALLIFALMLLGVMIFD